MGLLLNRQDKKLHRITNLSTKAVPGAITCEEVDNKIYSGRWRHFVSVHPEDDGTVFFWSDGKFLSDYVATSKSMLIFTFSHSLLLRSNHAFISHTILSQSSKLQSVKLSISLNAQFFFLVLHIPNSPLPIALTSLSKALPCFPPTFARRTKGHCLRTWEQ